MSHCDLDLPSRYSESLIANRMMRCTGSGRPHLCLPEPARRRLVLEKDLALLRILRDRQHYAPDVAARFSSVSGQIIAGVGEEVDTEAEIV